MRLSDEIKNKILEILDSAEFMNNLYVDENGKELDKATRDELGQFYTPGKICIKMIEKFNCESLTDQNILDPTCGSGNLLIACLIAGADLDKLYGNEYDAKVIPTCRKRILKATKILGLDTSKFNNWQIHRGDATDSFCLTEFGSDYKQKLKEHYLDLNAGDYFSLFEPELTKEQEDFLKEVD